MSNFMIPKDLIVKEFYENLGNIRHTNEGNEYLYMPFWLKKEGEMYRLVSVSECPDLQKELEEERRRKV